MAKIGILSDTHGLLRPEVLTALTSCEAIFHGGDINSQSILDELERIAPVYVVRGNNDKQWAEQIPETLDLTYQGLRIYMIHNKKCLPRDLTAYDLVLYGHSHKYDQHYDGDTLILNPGSCGPRRFHQEITLAILEAEDGKIKSVEKIVIPHSGAPAGKTEGEKAEESIPANLALILPDIMQDIDRGRSIRQIAKKYKLSEELSEQIARMYLTHPGVDVEGILRRLGV